MSYATQADIEARYPGELAQAGPRLPAGGGVDTVAVAGALTAADDSINLALSAAGIATPLAHVPTLVVTLAVDIALYLATPTVLASQADFTDRRKRYDTALSLLRAIADGSLVIPTTARLYTHSAARVFGRGAL